MLSLRLRPLVASALALLVLAVAPRARACSCVDAVFPLGEIPQNGKLFLSPWVLQVIFDRSDGLTDDEIARLQLVRISTNSAATGLGGAGGQPVDDAGNALPERVFLSATKIESRDDEDDVIVLHPSKLLTPGEWQLELPGAPDGISPPLSVRVTEGIDDVPPAIPVLESSKTIEDYSEDKECRNFPSLGFFAKFDDEEGILLLDDTRDEQYANTTLDGPVTLVNGGNRLFLGQVMCGHQYAPGTHVRFRVRRVDSAGNVSAWSKPMEATIPENDPGCSCSLPGGAQGAAWPASLAVGLGAALWLRRRNRALA